VSIINLARDAYSAAQRASQHSSSGPPPRARIGKPSFAPRNITTASGASLAWRSDSLPQSSSPVFEIPVPICGSRTVATPRAAS
jgi:hypothetical protein